MSEREAGWYWVSRHKGAPEIAKWTPNAWTFAGDDWFELDDENIHVLDGPLTPPKEGGDD